MVPQGVIHGRFQILHNDHLTYLLAGRARCEHLIIGITNPDPRLTATDAADPARSDPLANPLTYFERYSLMRAVLGEAGWAADEYSVVPFPISFPDLCRHYAPTDAHYFLSVYDDWGRRKLARLERQGLTVTVLSERPLTEKGLSASEIRRRMLDGRPWQDRVPPATARLCQAWDIPNRLRQLRDQTGALAPPAERR